ncbi:hypothetical protein [Granulicella sp. dw_53]|uniref:hypothetical protein n=1 Tax=Granulicella sp. dw_53 TaxID=2719792 RepID=UPI001BD3ED24|nr:hypothetical protein [Granulicella sp. dw_53]
MSGQVWTAIIGAISALLVASFTYWSSKRRDREADWRKLKLQKYEEFATSLAGMAEGNVTKDTMTRFNIASNSLHLIASQRVVVALEDFRREISAGNTAKTLDKHDSLLSRLFWEIRLDLGDQPTSNPSDFRMKLWTPGTKEASKLDGKDRD